MKQNDESTHFGYQKVKVDEKAEKVAEVFTSVANKYDVMNDLMSFGIHRLWKRFTIDKAALKAGNTVLDIAGGTGDLTKAFIEVVGDKGQVILADINYAMLEVGRERLINDACVGNLSYIQADAEDLPFVDNYFDCITIAFGLRNVTNINKALASMYRVLKPGGKLLILEFSKPIVPGLKPIYDMYSFSILPLLGKIVANDSASYQYLAESIRMHPDQEKLKQMILDVGFDQCDYFNLSGGIVALHRAYKY